MEGGRKGGRDVCRSEKIIASGRDAAIRVTLFASCVCARARACVRVRAHACADQPETSHVWTGVNNLAGDDALVLKGQKPGGRCEKELKE